MQGNGKILLIISVSLVLIFSGFCAFKVHTLSNEQVKVKSDYAVVNNISFGLLSVNRWRDQIVLAVSQQIQNFDLTKEQQKDLQEEIEKILNVLISKAVAMINKPQKSLGGKIKKIAFNTFIDTTELHAQVPVFAKEIIDQVEKPAAKEKLKTLARSKLQEVGKQTYDSSMQQEQFITDSIFNKYHVADAAAFENKTTSLLTTLRRTTYNYAFGMLLSTIVILILWIVFRKKTHLHVALYVLSVLSALILLLVGLTTTMIELDARIQTLDFRLIGTTISFHNQVLFFQSKSIIDVVKILLDTGKWDMIIVGILILAFSVLFPFAKLISTCICVGWNNKLSSNKIIQFFAYKSGKWSMADVMVVAIMMTYIGFNGVVESQLKSLNINDETITSITTNNTSLQPGYIIFVGFVVYGLILSQILKYVNKTREGKVAKKKNE